MNVVVRMLSNVVLELSNVVDVVMDSLLALEVKDGQCNVSKHKHYGCHQW